MKKSLNILVITLLLGACTYDKQQYATPSATSCDTSGATYSGKVLSIIQDNCYSCHGDGNNQGDVRLDGHINLKLYADNGRLSGTINHKTGFSPMPQGGIKLSDCDITIIEKWISNGSPDN